MSPVFTSKGTRQHRYYVTRLRPGEDRRSGWRVPAGDLDRAVLDCASKFLTRCAAEQGEGGDRPFPTELARHSVPEQRSILLEHKFRVRLSQSEIIIAIGDEPEQQVSIAAQLVRRGNVMKLVLEADGPAKEPDAVLIKLLANASAALEAVSSGTSDSLVSNYSKRHLWQLLRLNWLAPDIVTAIVEGRQPPSLTGRRLLRAADVPLSWEEQRGYFQFS